MKECDDETTTVTVCDTLAIERCKGMVYMSFLSSSSMS